MNIYSRFSLNIVLVISSILACSEIAISGPFGRPDFFEKGRDQFEEEIRRFEQGETVPDSSLKIDDTALPWSRIVIQEVGFTAMMPPGAITHEVETVEAPKGDINFDLIATHPSSSRYVVAYSEEVIPERVENAQEVLERSRDYIIENKIGLNKIADDNITFEDYRGLQFQLQNDQETIVYRLMLVKQRLYVLAVNQQNDHLSKDSIATFFESFKLLAS